jgi:hypothetical protein
VTGFRRASAGTAAPTRGVVANLRALDLDDVGAEIGEQLPGPGPGHHAAEIEDLDVR